MLAILHLYKKSPKPHADGDETIYHKIKNVTSS
jgi:hypothetical protein